MRLRLLPLFILLLFELQISAQDKVEIKMKSSSILLTGKASIEINPDEIEFRLSIREKTINDSIFTVEEQIKNLSKRLQEVGINNFRISEIISSSSKGRTYGTYDYDLNIKKPFSTELIIEILENEIKASYMVVSAGCQKCDSLKIEVKKLAVQNAKDKAETILSKLNKKCGEPLKVIETDNIYATNISIEYQTDNKFSEQEIGKFKNYKNCRFEYFSKITIKFKIE